jgi:hypothetical protein
MPHAIDAVAALKVRVIGGGWRYPAAQFAALLAVACTLLWPAPFDASQLPAMATPLSDLELSHWPSALFIKESVARARLLPLWNPSFGGGRPLAADPLAALLYPPTHLVHLLSVRDYLLVALAGHLLLAGTGMLVLARWGFGLSRAAALAAAVAYMATPRMVGHLGAGHLTMVQTAAWLPWVAAACRATVHDSARWSVGLGVCLALMALAGHPQLAYYGALMAVALSLWLLGARWRAAGARAMLRSALGLGIGAGLAGLLAAMHLLPFLEFDAHSTRQLLGLTTDTGDLAELLKAVAGVRIPSPVPHEALFEAGLSVLGLATLGALARWRAGVPMLSAVALVIGLALGQSSPVFRLAGALLPGLASVRGVARVWFLGALALALLGGLGADALASAARRWVPRAATWVGPACALAVAANLAWVDSGLARVGAVADATEIRPYERAAADAAGAGRVYGTQQNVRQLSAVALGARLAGGQDPLLIEPYAAFMARAGNYRFSGYHLSVPPFEVYEAGQPASQDARPDARLLGLLGVRVLASRTPPGDPRFVQFEQVSDTALYRNSEDDGPAYLVAPNGAGRPPTFDELRVLTRDIRPFGASPERQDFWFDAPQDDYLVIAAPAYPGWGALVDGEAVAVETIEGVLPAIPVRAGAHVVRYRYAPASVALGASLSLVGAILGLATLAGRRATRRRPARRSSSPAADHPLGKSRYNVFIGHY